MVEHLKHEGTSHSSSDLFKICVKMGASWSAQDFRQTGVTPSGPGVFLLLFSLAVFPLPGQKRCQCMPGPVAFPLSLSGLDCASSVLPRGQRPGFVWPDENLGPKRANWGKRSGYEQRRSFSACQHCGSFHKVNSYNNSIKDF